MATALPFLTLSDPLVTGEGALDPLGLAMIGERLADEILPGLRARMSRPRFLSAIAVSGAVCENLEDRMAADGITPSFLVFEWLVVEAFVREGSREETRGTPGTLKAQEVRDNGDALSHRTYLKTPNVFGFHGVYKPLARDMGIVDDDLRLADKGYELLKIWQTEQRLEGFLESALVTGEGRAARHTLRSALEDGLAAGYTKRSASWQGWSILAEHLSPANLGAKEAACLARLLEDPESEPRGEVFRLLRDVSEPGDAGEDQIVNAFVLRKCGRDLADRMKAIVAYEAVCGILEEAFDSIRFLSTHSRERPIDARTFAMEARSGALARELPGRLGAAEQALAVSPLGVQQLFAQLARGFAGVRDATDLFETVLARHEGVQKAKPPEGKRSWFERSPDGATFVRVPYRLAKRPGSARGWNRPYRIRSVLSFLSDLRGVHGAA
jgi:hypothetical protein